MANPASSSPVSRGLSSIESAFVTDTLERKSWQDTIAPQFIALFLWVVFFDQLAVKTLAVGGLGPSVAGAAVAGVLCFLLLYYAPASWGCQTGLPLTEVSASTFGRVGAARLSGVLFGVAQIVWCSVATYYATELILEGLASIQLLDPRALRPMVIVRHTVPSFLFLLTSAFWCCWAGLVGAYLVRVIAALMRVFPIFPACMLGVAMMMTIKDAVMFRSLGVDVRTGQNVPFPALSALLNMVQMVFGFFAVAGLASVEWGAASRSARDVRLGGLVGVVFAPWTVVTIVLLVVAGAQGSTMLEVGRGAVPPPSAAAFTFHDVIYHSIGGRLGCAMLLIFGLASLAPTTYTAFVIGQRLTRAWPRISRVRWSMIGSAAAWLFILTGFTTDLEGIFSVMGAIFAPMAGAMTAEYVRYRGRWPGARAGINMAGLVAWVAGLSVGLLPILGRAWGRPELARFQPAAVVAALTAFVVYLGLAMLGGEGPVESALAGNVSTSTAGDATT